jgi:hypothetical protein
MKVARFLKMAYILVKKNMYMVCTKVLPQSHWKCRWKSVPPSQIHFSDDTFNGTEGVFLSWAHHALACHVHAVIVWLMDHAWIIRLSALMGLYIHPLYVLVSKIISSILNSPAPIHPLYHPLTSLSTMGPTWHFI